MIGKLFSSQSRAPAAPAAPAGPAASAPAAEGPRRRAPPPGRLFDDSEAAALMLGNQLIQSILAQPALADPKRLERYGFKVYSQNEEDGILQEIFRRIGAPHRTFVEFGAGNGLENNSAYLLSLGWRGLWMDGGDENAALIRRGFSYLIDQGLLQFKHVFITRDNINELIASAALGTEIDFLSVDVDGNDLFIWQAIDAVNPRVVALEYNAKFPPPHEYSIAYHAEQVWDGTDRMGASLSALTRLSEQKGYVLVGCNIAGANAFYVRRDLVGDLFATPATAEHLYHPARYYLSPYFYSGHLGNSLTIVESAALHTGMPWPPAGVMEAIFLSR
jgi:hypothetical protein